VKNCTIEIVNDSTFEADETFQVKLSDLRTPAASSSNIRFNQFTTVTVTILNEEDGNKNNIFYLLIKKLKFTQFITIILYIKRLLL